MQNAQDDFKDRITDSMLSGMGAVTRWLRCASCGNPFPNRVKTGDLYVGHERCQQCRIKTPGK